MDTTTHDGIVIGYDALVAARAKRLRARAGGPLLLCRWRERADGSLACAWQREVDSAA
jgi:hypothetical protein